MININFRHNKDLLDKCRPLFEHSWLVVATRKLKSQLRDDPFDEEYEKELIREDGVQQGRESSVVQSIFNLMQSLILSASDTMSALGLSEEEKSNIGQ